MAVVLVLSAGLLALAATAGGRHVGLGLLTLVVWVGLANTICFGIVGIVVGTSLVGRVRVLRWALVGLRADLAATSVLCTWYGQGAALGQPAAERDIEVSFDGGATWTAALPKPQRAVAPSVFVSFWTPVPAGTTRVHIRGQPWFSRNLGDQWLPWLARGISVWAPAPDTWPESGSP